MVPRSLWTWLTMYLNATARKKCLRESQLTRGGQLFSRRVQRPIMIRASSNGRDLTMRRTPSPRRRVATVEPSTVTTRKISTGAQATDSHTPLRTNTGSSFSSLQHSPIPEESQVTSQPDHMTSTPLHTPDWAKGGFRFSPADVPLRSASASSAESAGSRSPVLRRLKHSRVLCVPSVATTTFVPQTPITNINTPPLGAAKEFNAT